MSTETCPTSAPFFGFMGVTIIPFSKCIGGGGHAVSLILPFKNFSYHSSST